jgi:hypothetical protein
LIPETGGPGQHGALRRASLILLDGVLRDVHDAVEDNEPDLAFVDEPKEFLGRDPKPLGGLSGSQALRCRQGPSASKPSTAEQTSLVLEPDDRSDVIRVDQRVSSVLEPSEESQSLVEAVEMSSAGS